MCPPRDPAYRSSSGPSCRLCGVEVGETLTKRPPPHSEPEQQTVAEAVRSVTQQQQAAQSTTETQDRSAHTSTQSAARAGGHSGTGSRHQSPLDLGDSVTSLVSTVTDADDAVADVIASNLIELICQANDESFPDDESSK